MFINVQGWKLLIHRTDVSVPNRGEGTLIQSPQCCRWRGVNYFCIVLFFFCCLRWVPEGSEIPATSGNTVLTRSVLGNLLVAPQLRVCSSTESEVVICWSFLRFHYYKYSEFLIILIYSSWCLRRTYLPSPSNNLLDENSIQFAAWPSLQIIN